MENDRRLAILDALIKTKDDLYIPNEVKRTTLILSVINRNEESAKILIKAGAKVDEKDNGGRTVAHYFAENNGSQPLFNALIGKVFDLNIRGHSDQTPLILEIKNKNEDVAMKLLKDIIPSKEDMVNA